MDGVKVVRIPLFKPFPHRAVSERRLKKQTMSIHAYCKKEQFEPNVIVAHNFYPHIPIVNMLKSIYYPQCISSVVIHKQQLNMLNLIKNKEQQLSMIDLWGYRSLPLKKEFAEASGLRNERYFMCYSGIPSVFVGQGIERKFEADLSHFVYVGSFIKRKHADKVFEALYKVGNPFHLDFVGDGANRIKVEKQVAYYGMTNDVTFYGFVERSTVPYIVRQAECFVMISEEETFGLVYLEAMALGCLTIASQGEGMDGIIIDGVNGFLCKAGDSDNLVNTIIRINRLTPDEKRVISKNARDTALHLTDTNAAKMYAESLFSRK